MFQVLVVDDDIIAVEGVKVMIDCARNQIDLIFASYDIEDAIKILKEQKIDVLICDIEMPGGSGIDLMEWLNQTQKNLVSIFLTSHADFQYAKKAIELKIFRYLLKPIDEEVLNATIEEGLKEKRESLKRDKQIYAAREILIAKILAETLEGTVRAEDGSMMRRAQKDGVEEFFQKSYCLILLSAKNLSDENRLWKLSLLEYAVSNMAEEIFSCRLKTPFLYRYSQLEFFLFCPDMPDIKERSQKLIAMCNLYLCLNLCCYISRRVEYTGFFSTMQTLLHQERHNISRENQSFMIDERVHEKHIDYLFDMGMIEALMKSEKLEEVSDMMVSRIDSLTKKGKMNSEILENIFFDFTQLIYSFLSERNIQAHLIFSTEENRKYFERGMTSIFNFKKYVRHVLRLVQRQLTFVSNEKSVIEMVIEYIHSNLDKSLTREKVSSYVFLNPDHLTRLMKKKTGMSIPVYVTYARVERAKELLASTNLSVTEIAVATGFPYYTYFSSTFKKATGFSPTDYRKQCRENTPEAEG